MTPRFCPLLSFSLALTASVSSTSQVKYREKYINSLGTWKSIPDRPEFFFSRIVNDNVSSVSAFFFYVCVLTRRRLKDA